MEFVTLCELALSPGEELAGAAVDRRGIPIVAVARRGSLSVRTHESGEWRERLEVPRLPERPLVDLVGDGVVVVSTRCVRGRDGSVEANAELFGASGSPEARFAVGDGVEAIGATAAGEIWVSYRDEGTMGDFGVHGWGRLDPRTWVDPIGRAGLACFDLTGLRKYELEPPPGTPPAADCFALNAGDDGAWACYHPEFPLVQVDSGGRSRAWATGGIGADALAVAGDAVALYVGYGRHRHTCVFARLGDGELTQARVAHAALDDGTPVTAIREVFGRGRELHAVTDRRWYRFALDG